MSVPNGWARAGYEGATRPRSLRLSRRALDVAATHVRERAPEEACGLLLGREARSRRHIVQAVPTPNRARGATMSRYLISPRDMREAEAAAARAGLEVVGAYHGHPDGTAEPSARDREDAWPWYSYLILPLEAGRVGAARAWRLLEDRSGFEEEQLVIMEDE